LEVNFWDNYGRALKQSPVIEVMIGFNFSRKLGNFIGTYHYPIKPVRFKVKEAANSLMIFTD